MIEQTYIMLKPDAVQRGLMGEIIARIELGRSYFKRALCSHCGQTILP